MQFDWEAIEGLLARELQGVEDGKLVRVPGLKESYVHRDSWTRLNVKPAKIMQVCALTWLVYKYNVYIHLSILLAVYLLTMHQPEHPF